MILSSQSVNSLLVNSLPISRSLTRSSSLRRVHSWSSLQCPRRRRPRYREYPPLNRAPVSRAWTDFPERRDPCKPIPRKPQPKWRETLQGKVVSNAFLRFKRYQEKKKQPGKLFRDSSTNGKGSDSCNPYRYRKSNDYAAWQFQTDSEPPSLHTYQAKKARGILGRYNLWQFSLDTSFK